MARSVYSAFVLFLLAALATSGYGQGSTTSSLTGVVVDGAGPIIGATVKATHVPTGTISGGITNSSGRFSLINLRAGGPYTLEVSYIGYQTYTKEGLLLTLGQTLDLSVSMVEEGVTTEEIVISAGKGDIFDGKRTGTETNISSQQIKNAPTVNRSLADLTRLTPQAVVDGNGAISIAGTNNRYNNISIDGAVSNDVFGLAATGTPGGQTNSRNGTQTAQPISLDAIEEIQVVIAPYDVRQGSFTGGGINAVTRSGTNELSGSVYGFTREKSLTGKLEIERPGGVIETRELGNDFSYYQAGFRLGGPIVKNKLFYFINFETTKSEEPRQFLAGDPGRNFYNTEASLTTLEDLVTILTTTLPANFPGQIAPFPDANGFRAYTNQFNNDKLLVKLDWNLSDNHRISFRHNFVRSRKQEAPSDSPSNINFTGGGQDFVSTTHSSVVEVNSTFGSNFSNKFRVVFQLTKDDRDPLGEPYPNLRFNDLDGTGDVFLGSEAFSGVNALDQTNIAITNDFSIFKGNHTITIGTHNEYFRFLNRFIRNAFGTYNVQTDPVSFAANPVVPSANYQLSYVNPDLGLPSDWGPEFDAFQLGLYAQDEWRVNAKLNLTFGLRVDVPFVSATPGANAQFNNDPIFSASNLGLDDAVLTQQLPDVRLMLAPRIGFNYDVFGDRTLQVRGGVGVFTGRVPFVWISNQFGNTGVEIIRFEALSGGGNIPFRYIPGAPRLGALTIPEVNALNGTSLNPGVSEINVTSKDFRYPQVFRTNLGFDYKLPLGLIGTFDFLFTKTLNAIHYEDLNLAPATGTYGLPAGNTSGGDERLLYPGTGTTRQSRSTNYTNVILLTNTSRGYGYTGTVGVQRPLTEGGYYSFQAAYTFGRATSINDGTSSQAISNWRFTPNVNGLNTLNQFESTTSNYQINHRIITSVTGVVAYGGFGRTTLTLFYQGRSGDRYSFIYNDDANREDLVNTNGNDLIFVPATRDQINLIATPGNIRNPATGLPYTADEQWALLDAFIAQDPYLSSRRGQYAERNGAEAPWNHQIDASLRQDFYLDINGKEHTLQLSVDVFNVANLINKEWGRQYFAGFNTFELITFRGFSGSVPQYNFIPPSTGETYSTSTGASIWQMQLGVRYSF